MADKINLTFIPIVIILIGLISLTSYTYIQTFLVLHVLTPFQIKILTVLSIILPLLLITTMITSGIKYIKILNYIYTVSATWLAIIFYLFLMAVILAVVNLIYPNITSIISFMTLGRVLFSLIIIFVIYGIYNATNIKVTNYVLPAKDFGAEMVGKKVVLVSDVHIGIVRGKSFVQKVVNKINEQNPDVVLIAGDLIDGPVFPFSDFLSPFENIKSKSGIYYIDGNHEKYTRRYNEYMTELKKLPINILNDKIATVLGVQIIGFDYKGKYTKEDFQNILSANNYDKNIPAVAMLHDPKYSPLLSALGMNLVVSGHTHHGQFFPLNLLVKGLYGKYAYGEIKIENNYHITSSGVGTAMSPLRLGTKAEIVTIEFK